MLTAPVPVHHGYAEAPQPRGTVAEEDDLAACAACPASRCRQARVSGKRGKKKQAQEKTELQRERGDPAPASFFKRHSHLLLLRGTSQGDPASRGDLIVTIVT
jgi:hypothetical protein